MNTQPKPWNLEWVESDEGMKAIEEIVRQVKDQEGQKMGIFVDKMMKIIFRKIKEAENTRKEMKPTIERDFGINPLPENFKIFLIDYLEQLGKTINPTESTLKYNERPVKPNKILDSYVEQLDLLAEQINMDVLLRTFGEWRENKFNKSKHWYDTYKGLKDSGYIDTSEKTFEHVMQHRHLPKGADKILWVTAKADAIYFQKELKFSMPQFNNCFRSKDVYPFKAGQKPHSRRNKNLRNIVEAAAKILNNK